MNKVILTGRLTADPETLTSASGTTIARFSIAVDRRFKSDNGPTADFFNCSAFSKTADFIEKYFKKGNKINIVGRLENNDYTNNSGQKVRDIKVIVEEVEFGEAKGETKDQVTEDAKSFLNVPDNLVEELPFS